MTDRLEYLTWCADRATFIERMGAYTNPITGTPLASMVDGVLVPSDGVRIDEIGPITKGDGTYDAEGNVITPPTVVPGHHVNIWAVGPLAAALTAGKPKSGDVFARTNILALLGTMTEKPKVTKGVAKGVPAGREGASGMRVFDASAATSRSRIWA